MKFVNKIAKATPAILGGLFAVQSAFAASWAPTGGTNITDVDALVSTILTTITAVAAIIAVIFLIINGIKYITSTGDSNKTEEAQKGIISALIGLVVVGAAFLLVRFIVTSVLGGQTADLD